MKLRLSLVIGVLALALSAVVAVAAPSAQGARSTSGAPTDQITGTNGLSGTFNVTSFKKVDGVIRAYGTFTGTDSTGASVTDTGYAEVAEVDGHALPTTDPTASTNALTQQAAAACQVLDLTLGPLHLDLLGLVVDLNAIHLHIEAQPGSGNLLGNLLCAVAGLLDNTGGATGGLNGLLTQLQNLLNQILAAL